MITFEKRDEFEEVLFNNVGIGLESFLFPRLLLHVLNEAEDFLNNRGTQGILVSKLYT